MKLNELAQGVIIECKDVHDVMVKGTVENFLQRTIIVRDENMQAHLIRKKELKEKGYTFPRFKYVNPMTNKISKNKDS